MDGGGNCEKSLELHYRPAGFARPRAERRGLLRPARAPAAAALLALSGSLALPATAEAQTVISPAAPTGFTAAVGNAQVTLAWTRRLRARRSPATSTATRRTATIRRCG